MLNFWVGFISGLLAMLTLATSCAVWFIFQAANFHDSWLTEKENKKNRLT